MCLLRLKLLHSVDRGCVPDAGHFFGPEIALCRQRFLNLPVAFGRRRHLPIAPCGGAADAAFWRLFGRGFGLGDDFVGLRWRIS